MRFVLLLFRLGMLTVVLHVIHFCKNREFCEDLHEFDRQVLVQLGSVFPNASAVYFHCWCAIFERDGSDLIFR